MSLATPEVANHSSVPVPTIECDVCDTQIHRRNLNGKGGKVKAAKAIKTKQHDHPGLARNELVGRTIDGQWLHFVQELVRGIESGLNSGWEE